jgi:hypothetical protein
MSRWSELRQGRGGRRWRRGRGQRLRRPRAASRRLRWRRGGSGGVGGIVLGLRVGAGGEVVGHRLCLGGGGATLRRRRRRSHGDERSTVAAAAAWLHGLRAVEWNDAGSGRRLKFLISDGALGGRRTYGYVRRLSDGPSDISLCPTASLTAVSWLLLFSTVALGRRT